MDKRRVVITGIGPVTAIGKGSEQFFQNILEKQTNISALPVGFYKDYRFKTKFYVPFPKTELDYVKNKTVHRITDNVSKLAIEATYLALGDSGYSIEEGTPNFVVRGVSDADIIFGVGVGSLYGTYVAHMNHLCTKGELIEKNTPQRFPRMTVPNVMTSACAAWASILFGVTGSCYTLNTACASGTYAIGEAFQRIKHGMKDIVICGGVEALKDEWGTTVRSFDTLSTLTQSDSGFPMPFSKNRSGFLFSEGGAAVLVLESYERAIKRGARIYAEIEGYRANSDAYNIVQLSPEGDKIGELIRKLKGDKKIDYFNTHGTATALNDRVEAEKILEIFGKRDSQPLLNATKGLLGHTIGASGAIECAVTALSLYHQKVHGNICDDPMDDLNLPLDSQDAKLEYGITTSYGFGGQNSGLLLKRYKNE